MTALTTGLFRQQPRSKAFYWLHAMSQSADSAARLAALIDVCADTEAPLHEAAARLGPGPDADGGARALEAQLLCLRGLLGCGVLVHCLAMRHRVEFGLNTRCAAADGFVECASIARSPLLPQRHRRTLSVHVLLIARPHPCRPDAKTRMAVPYEACDLPSRRSEYKHPDTAIVLTILAYYQDGLTQAALRDVVQGLATLPVGTRNSKYRYVPALTVEKLMFIVAVFAGTRT